MQHDDTSSSIPYGYCHCGCGQKTNLAKRNYHDRGIRKGEPMRFAPAHGGNAKSRKPRPLPILVPSINACLIPLVGQRGEGLYALVDVEDVHLVAPYRWTVTPFGYVRSHSAENRDIHFLIHQVLLPAPDGFMIDHADGNKLDNRRRNIRIATPAENTQNRRLSTGRRYRGVHWDKRRGNWVAAIRADNKVHRLGTFDREIDGAIAYDEAARRLHGEFARLNFPD